MKWAIFVIALIASSCGYDGYYRYPCQDPQKFETPECIPPQCLMNDQCSKDMFEVAP